MVLQLRRNSGQTRFSRVAPTLPVHPYFVADTRHHGSLARCGTSLSLFIRARFKPFCQRAQINSEWITDWITYYSLCHDPGRDNELILSSQLKEMWKQRMIMCQQLWVCWFYLSVKHHISWDFRPLLWHFLWSLWSLSVHYNNINNNDTCECQNISSEQWNSSNRIVDCYYAPICKSHGEF